jgi:small subunit ribosomal protein S1
MEPSGKWIPGDVAPDEAYWQALLSGEEEAGSVSVAGQADLWVGREVGTQAIPRAANAQDYWEDARRVMENGDELELPVIGYNRGGVVVGWNGLRGFVPASHLVSLPSSLNEDERQSALQHLVGMRLNLKIIELDSAQSRLVLSERASSLDEGHRQDALDRILPGDVCQGQVTNLCSFGAFVDLGGVEGLVHVSELSWERVEHPGDVLELGQPVEVYVINVDRERGRVGLSLKRLQPDPWQFVGERYQVGQIVDGTVTNVVDFGAFARVEEGLEGLIHVSELSEADDLHPRDVVRVGDAVKALIISIDGERRRMGLSLRQVDNPYFAGQDGF